MMPASASEGMSLRTEFRRQGPGFVVKRQGLDTEEEEVKMGLTARQDEAVVETPGKMGKHLKWHIMPAMTTSGDGCHPSGSRGFN
jgi:hypothetical protein